MAVQSRSSKAFMERGGLRRTLRGPLPAHDFGVDANKIHAMPLEEPMPIPEAAAVLQNVKPPDRGRTEEWPNGSST